MKKLIVIVFLSTSVFLLAQTGEFLIDTDIGYTPALNNQNSPSIAFDGTNYFAVWHEDRYTDANDFNIYGTRIGQDGTILDPHGIAISTAQHSQEFPAVAFDGTNYFVVWQSGTSGANFYDICGARVDPSGNVLDPGGIAISTTGSEERAPSVAFDGTNYLVVWGHGYSDIYGARVNQAGTVLDPGGLIISAASGGQSFPSIAFDGTNYLVAWSDGRDYFDIYGARVEPSGNVLDPDGIPISITPDCQARPSVSFGRDIYFVVWQDWPSGGIPDIYGTRIDKNGVILDPPGIAISAGPSFEASPSVAFDGTSFLVTWHDSRSGFHEDIYGARVDTLGNVLDPAGIAISTAAYQQYYPEVAFGDTNYLVVWTDWRKGYSPDIYGARVNKQGAVLEPAGIIISTMMYWHSNPSVSYDGTNYFVVWQDYRNGSEPDIYGARVDPSGIILDPMCIGISATTGWQYEPAIIYNGTEHFVVWADNRTGNYSDIYGARVGITGNVLDPSGIPISTATNTQYSPKAAFDGTNYFVVWTDLRSGSYSHIYGARVTASGTVLDPSGILISTGDYWQCYQTLAFDGINYFVVWADYNSGGNSYDLYGARVDPSGNVLDPAGIPISVGSGQQRGPSVVFNNGDYFVAWQDSRNEGGLVYDIYGARIDTSGNVLDPQGIPIITAPNSQECPSLVFDGTNYLCVWQDSRNDFDYYDIYGAELDISGTVIDSFAVSTQTENQITPVLAKGAGEQSLINYSGFTDYINGQPANIMRTWGKFYPFTGIEENTLRTAPDATRLQVYPNPFSEKTEIRWTIYDRRATMIRIYDATGRLVRYFPISQLTNLKSLINYVSWDGTDDFGRQLPSGIYFIQMNTKEFKSRQKIIFVH